MLYTVSHADEYTATINRSRFIGNIAYVESQAEAKDFIAVISKKHPEASHICWAYQIDVNLFHYSDAGEPAGTAGKPIYGVLNHHSLNNTVITVTRYFGGVKLGVRGLIDAYRQIADATVAVSKLKPMIMMNYYKITLSYKNWDRIRYLLEEMSVTIGETNYQEKITALISSADDLSDLLERESQNINTNISKVIGFKT